MKCLMDKSREVSYPCSHACPLFGDCVVEFEIERSAGGMGGHGHKHEDIVAFAPQTYPPTTNGDRVRSMNDAALAEWIVSVIDFALRQNGIVKSSVICAAYKQRFLMHLRRPAEEEK